MLIRNIFISFLLASASNAAPVSSRAVPGDDLVASTVKLVGDISNSDVTSTIPARRQLNEITDGVTGTLKDITGTISDNGNGSGSGNANGAGSNDGNGSANGNGSGNSNNGNGNGANGNGSGNTVSF